MKTITVIRTSDLSLPHSVRSYIDGCAHEYSETDPWTKIGAGGILRGCPHT